MFLARRADASFQPSPARAPEGAAGVGAQKRDSSLQVGSSSPRIRKLTVEGVANQSHRLSSDGVAQNHSYDWSAHFGQIAARLRDSEVADSSALPEAAHGRRTTLTERAAHSAQSESPRQPSCRADEPPHVRAQQKQRRGHPDTPGLGRCESGVLEEMSSEERM